MSHDISNIPNTGCKQNRNLTLTEFCGPQSVGMMIQLTQGLANLGGDLDEPGFIQLSPRDAYFVIQALSEWIKPLTDTQEEK